MTNEAKNNKTGFRKHKLCSDIKPKLTKQILNNIKLVMIRNSDLRNRFIRI